MAFIAIAKKNILAPGLFLFSQPLLVFYKNKGAGDFAYPRIKVITRRRVIFCIFMKTWVWKAAKYIKLSTKPSSIFY